MKMYYRDGGVVCDKAGYHPHRETRFTCFDPTVLSVKAERLPVLYDDRSACCGCGACKCICPVGAISMVGDEEGFAYPVVDADACIGCKKCMVVCAFKDSGR